MSNRLTHVLVVEADPREADRLRKRLLDARTGAYAVSVVRSLQGAIARARGVPVDVMLASLSLPDSSGLWTVEIAASELPHVPLIVLAPDDDENVGLAAVKAGAEDYVLRDEVKGRALARAIRYAVERHRAKHELRQGYATLRRAFEGVIRVITTMTERRDPYTAGHMGRVASLARRIASELGLDEDVITATHMAGLVHDLGKIAVPAEILSRPGLLNHTETDLIKYHCDIGHDILAQFDFPWPIADIVHQHHERIDGSGYPRGLAGSDVRLEARIIAVADVVEAMASHRPYRPARGIEEALVEIERSAGSAYDPDVACTCLRLFRDWDYHFLGEGDAGPGFGVTDLIARG